MFAHGLDGPLNPPPTDSAPSLPFPSLRVSRGSVLRVFLPSADSTPTPAKPAVESFHCGSGCQNAQAYPAALAVARSLFDLAARQGVKLTLLDIGGGFPGWDGSECVYQPTPRGGTAAGEEAGRLAVSESAGTSSAPSATVQSVPDAGSTRDSGRDREGGGGSGTAVAHVDGATEGSEEDVSASPPPLSLAEIAQVTLPVLDELFPTGSGVQVIQ